jgi:hypothetical protein
VPQFFPPPRSFIPPLISRRRKRQTALGAQIILQMGSRGGMNVIGATIDSFCSALRCATSQYHSGADKTHCFHYR